MGRREYVCNQMYKQHDLLRKGSWTDADKLEYMELNIAPYSRYWRMGMKKALKHAIRLLREEEAKADRKNESNSEIPNNCEHITEDGVTCAKYPACDDCPDNLLNKVKGSERLVKGSEQTEPTGYNLSPVDKDINVRSKTEPTMRLHEWTSDDITFCTAKCEVKCFRKPKYIKHKDIPHSFSDFSNSCVEYEPEDEPQFAKDINVRSKDEPQTDCPWK